MFGALLAFVGKPIWYGSIFHWDCESGWGQSSLLWVGLELGNGNPQGRRGFALHLLGVQGGLISPMWSG